MLEASKIRLSRRVDLLNGPFARLRTRLRTADAGTTLDPL